MKSQNGEKWGYIDSFKHEQGQSKCVFETDEDGSFLQLTLMNEDVGEENVPELLEVINIMNGIQDQVRFFYHLGNGSLFAKREFIVEGRKPKKIQEMVFERYDRMKDIFDDVLWAFDWKVKTAVISKPSLRPSPNTTKTARNAKTATRGRKGLTPLRLMPSRN